MATASNQYGTSVSFSGWSAWGAWSATADVPHTHGTSHIHQRDTDGHTHDLDPDGDELGNGIQDDTVGCPIPAPPTPINPLPCSHDPSLQAAVYPAGHSEPYTDANGNGSYDTGEPYTDINDDGSWTADLAGHRTGFCFPITTPPHTCLLPGALCLGTGS